MASYAEQVRAMVRKLRLEDDELTRLALADLLTEDGRPEAERRTAALLRAGRMVLATIDVAALTELLNFYQLFIQSHDPAWDFVWDLCVSTYLELKSLKPRTASPNDYVAMWQLAMAYVDKMSEQVAEEVRALLQTGHQDQGRAEPERAVGSGADSAWRGSDW